MVVIAYLLNGEDITLPGPEVTLNGVRAESAKKLGTFAPDIIVVYASTGEAPADDAFRAHQADGPVKVRVASLKLPRDDEQFWMTIACARIEGKDKHAACRALGEISAGLVSLVYVSRQNWGTVKWSLSSSTREWR